MFQKSFKYESLRPLSEIMALLPEVALGKVKVNHVPNLYKGSLDETGSKAILMDKGSNYPFKTYTVELTEADGMPVIHITVASTIWAWGMEFFFIAMAAVILYFHDSLSDFIICLAGAPLFFPYAQYMNYSSDAWAIGVMLDPLYFESPEAGSLLVKGSMHPFSFIMFIVYAVSAVGVLWMIIRPYFPNLHF